MKRNESEENRMKKRIIEILNGIADGIFPNVNNSIKIGENGREINRARLTASVLSWMVGIGFIKGWIKLEDLAEILKLIFLTDI